MPTLYFRPDEVAARWRVSSRTIHRHIARGTIPVLVIGRQKLIPADYIEQLEREQLGEAAPAREEAAPNVERRDDV